VHANTFKILSGSHKQDRITHVGALFWLMIVTGISIDQVAHLEQKIRDRVGTQMLAITLKELFTFRFMQASLSLELVCLM
jgi:hypothetical protein